MRDILERSGPCLSSDLAAMLVERDGITPEAARKRVSRGLPDLMSLRYLPFPKKARFLYLREQYRSPVYWRALRVAIMQTESAYALAYAAVQARGGVIPERHFAIACGSPGRQKKHLSAETVLERMFSANIFESCHISGVGTCILSADVFEDSYPICSESLGARLITEDILLKAIRTWAQNIGFVSYDKVQLRDEDDAQPKFGTFNWDFTAPSYISALTDWDKKANKPRPGFIACDVMLHGEVDEKDLEPFLHKCASLRSLRKLNRCMFIIVGHRFTQNAFRKAKQNGIIPATPETLFGSEVAEGLVQLTAVLTDAARACFNPEVLGELFRKLKHIEGTALNLRGVLFEFLAKELATCEYAGASSIRRGIKVPDPAGGIGAEVDLIVERGDMAVHFIECKGYHPSGTIKLEFVKTWIEKRIPFVRKWALEKHPLWQKQDFIFELWTTCRLTNEAWEFVNSRNTSKYTIVVRDRDEIERMARQTRNTPLIKTLEEHFMHHPLATIEEEVRKKNQRRRQNLTVQQLALDKTRSTSAESHRQPDRQW